MKCKRCKKSKGIVYWNVIFPFVCYKCYNELLEAKAGVEIQK